MNIYLILDKCPILRDLLSCSKPEPLFRSHYEVPKIDIDLKNDYEMVSVEKLQHMRLTIKRLRSRCYKLKKTNENLRKVSSDILH